ncbi:hypothetical protein Droror1_Dr00024521 [Drosera rotundifolia]
MSDSSSQFLKHSTVFYSTLPRMGKPHLPTTRHHCPVPATGSKKRPWPSMMMARSQMGEPSTYKSSMRTDIPLYETNGALFDEYLEDKRRVFRAIFPDKRRSQQLSEDEWRIHMLPIDFLFLTVWPVTDMKLSSKSGGHDYPPGVPSHISRVLELDLTRWELQGLQDVAQPSHFSLSVKGALYPDRLGGRSHLKGLLEMKISVVLPPLLALVPEDVLRSVSESVLRTLVENMKDKVNVSLLADYSQFRNERQKSLV